jgi:hypothetical protein
MMEKTRIRGRGRCVRTWLAVCLAVAACASTAGAQTFKSDEPKMSDAEGNALNQTVMQLKESGLAGGEARSQFESYFKDYLFPVMTRTTAEGLTRIGNHRERLLRLFQAPIHDQSFQALTALTLAEMKRIATDNYHPATRYNAMLIIGALDQQPGSPTGGAAQAPQPLAEATDFLIQMLEADRSQAPDLVKLGAIVGLERHARSGLPDDKRKAVTDQLVELVVAERPNYRTAEFHAWLQWRAVDVLTQLGELGENNRVHNAIVTFMANDNAPLTERYYAAKSLEKLKPKYTPQAGIDAQATVAALGNVLADVMASEKE